MVAAASTTSRMAQYTGHRRPGAHEVDIAIRNAWENLGGETGMLGYPLTDTTAAPDGSNRYAIFQHGTVFCTSSCEVLNRYLYLPTVMQR